MRAIQRLVAKDEMILDVDVKERQVNGIRTLQLETLGASAIQCFDKVRPGHGWGRDLRGRVAPGCWAQQTAV